MKSSSGLETDTLYVCTYTIYSVKWEKLFGINQAENSNFDKSQNSSIRKAFDKVVCSCVLPSVLTSLFRSLLCNVQSPKM